ncbi:MAG: glutaredoxin 3 [Epulopiscium sp.]|uniref:NrdH-redoxin n=1 Tax=Defluviitalea raffinosedens TaxID=1450156 RepID=A0A7C8LSV8_9FIRM|nr:glutaredoxin domain-containing protein [Defluviitalea raffinosedens]MBZ4669594.1 glutaredoxin-like protein YruB-family [Defluviitaleaceae bacterium]MDK2789289.1 glutaredoxin 3 [Candidatus Epulonipiscium sp.]KAE9633487.1 NrdH-redoxin [Defluviitalea raffinosedens]MBM7685958.1 glutaredoxin-like YruB-family protein [Defluviitalea raffinosedens]HHW68174.1 NrdH-redoxin [Candidatus Epulonipiscium sp.]
MKNITVYSTPTCPYCHMVKDYLKKNDFQYKDINVAVDQRAAAEMIKKSGQMGVPVIDIDGNIVVGFDREKINSLLGL